MSDSVGCEWSEVDVWSVMDETEDRWRSCACGPRRFGARWAPAPRIAAVAAGGEGGSAAKMALWRKTAAAMRGAGLGLGGDRPRACWA